MGTRIPLTELFAEQDQTAAPTAAPSAKRVPLTDLFPQPLEKPAFQRAVEWVVDAPILKPVADEIRKRPWLEKLLSDIPFGPGVIGKLAGVIGAVSMSDVPPDVKGRLEMLVSAVEAGGREATPAALEFVAPIDIATVGTGLAGSTMLKAGIKGGRALHAASRLLDIGEGVYGTGQVVSGVREGDLAKIGVGAARAAGGTAALLGGRPAGEAVEAAEATLGGTPVSGVHPAGRPMTRRKYAMRLLDEGVPGNELRGKSANEMADMLRNRGIDPKTLGGVEELAEDAARVAGDVEGVKKTRETAGASDPNVFAERTKMESGMDVPPDDYVDMPPSRAETRTVEPTRTVQEEVDQVLDVDDPTLFDQRMRAESGMDVPEDPVLEDLIARMEAKSAPVTQPPAGQIAMHPELGQVRVDAYKGNDAYISTYRGRRMVVSRDRLRFLEEEPSGRQPGPPEKTRPVVLSEAEKSAYGIEPDEPPLIRHHPSRRARRRPPSTPGQPPPSAPRISPQQTGLTPETAQKLRAVLVAQRQGRFEADAKNIHLHARQFRIVQKWQDAVQAGEISATDASLKTMQELAGLRAGIENVTGAGFTPAQLEELHNLNYSIPWTKKREEILRAGEIINAIQRGKQLQDNQFLTLRKLFGPLIVPQTALEKSWLSRILRGTQFLSGTFRSLKASWDISAPGRQALLLSIRHPDIAARAFWMQLRSLANAKYFDTEMDAIMNNPLRELQEAAGLHLSELTPRHHTILESVGFERSEEVFSGSGLAQHIPGVRPSERAYIMYLNKMRSDVFNKMALSMMKNGVSPDLHPGMFRDVAEAVNNLSGRGTMSLPAPGFGYLSGESQMGKIFGVGTHEAYRAGSQELERAVPLLQSAFFAPRFMQSRLAILRDLPLLYANYSGPARRLMLESVGSTVLAGMAALTALKQLGVADVELDPRSSDFAKVRVGNTRFDPWGGFQPWVRFLWQFTTGERKAASGEVYTLGEGIQPSRLELGYRFLEQKASPLAGIIRDLTRGQQMTGEDLEFMDDEFPYVGRGTWEQVLPLVFVDLIDVMQEGEREMLAVTLPVSMVGVGVQTYEPRKKRPSRF